MEDKRAYFISLLDDFLDGKLDAAKEAEIKKALQEDSFLNKVLKQHVDARANIRHAGETDLKNKFLDQFDPIPDVVESKPSFLKRFWWLLFLLGIGAAAAYYFSTQKEAAESSVNFAINQQNIDELILANVEDPSYDLLRSEVDAISAGMWQVAVKNFTEKKYDETLLNLNGIASDSSFVKSHLGKYSLMKGVCYFKSKKFKSAEKSLANISVGNPYFDQAEWYLALNYHFSGNVKKAIEQFEKIAQNSTHFKNEQATKYLSNLSQND